MTVTAAPSVGFALESECLDLKWRELSIRNYNRAFPETSATYWALTFNLTEHDRSKKVAFRVHGQFPHARYLSFVIYNFEVGLPQGYLIDTDLQAYAGSTNPFLPGADRSATPREYELWIIQPGDARVDQPNTLLIPTETDNVIVLMRVYLPDDRRDLTGDVGLPALHAVNTVKDPAEGETACPQPVTADLPTPPPARVPPVGPLAVRSYRAPNAGLFGNGRNPYLTAPLIHYADAYETVAVLRFRAPTFQATFAATGGFSGDEQVRYWSVCLGGTYLTDTSACFYDEAAQIDDNGWVKVMVGPAAKIPASVPGWNIFAWDPHPAPLLLFRQIEPLDGFEGSFLNVEHEQPAEPIIHDYAPSGRYCTLTEFNRNHCGL